MKEPQWVHRRALLLLHEETLAEHGGSRGLRDEGLLDSALARPRNRYAYKRKCDLADLAAAYAFGICQNHPFRDGNKRMGFLAAGLFLELNGYSLIVDQLDAVETFFALASGQRKEREIAAWLRKHIHKMG